MRISAADARKRGWLPAMAQRPRHEPGKMNKTEEKYAGYLEGLRLAGEIAMWAFEPLKLRLADRTYYEIDFLVQLPDGRLEVHEVKGHWEDDARVKFKVAAELHAWLAFKALKLEGGLWVEA